MATQASTLIRSTAPASAGVMLPAFTLWWREIVRFYRQPTRVVGVLASPLVFWLVIGSGFGTSFRSGGGPGQQHYLDYFYPGAMIMIVLFTSIFTMMSVIEDRKEGFLLSVLVAGAMLPLTGASKWIPVIMRLNPLTYGVAALRGLMYPGAETSFPLSSAIATLVLFSLVMFG